MWNYLVQVTIPHVQVSLIYMLVYANILKVMTIFSSLFTPLSTHDLQEITSHPADGLLQVLDINHGVLSVLHKDCKSSWNIFCGNLHKETFEILWIIMILNHCFQRFGRGRHRTV